ncbi:hypothetical protein HZB00_00815 [Candidatus Woesearchaeota archaeon]|nr:hypothetical protein [Candidatus Woesearchaeota archaeon]
MKKTLLTGLTALALGCATLAAPTTKSRLRDEVLDIDFSKPSLIVSYIDEVRSASQLLELNQAPPFLKNNALERIAEYSILYLHRIDELTLPCSYFSTSFTEIRGILDSALEVNYTLNRDNEELLQERDKRLFDTISALQHTIDLCKKK